MVPDEPLQEVLDRFWRRAEPRGAVLENEHCTATEGEDGSFTHGGCGQTLVSWSYTGEKGEPREVRVCASGDAAYMMPRFL